MSTLQNYVNNKLVEVNKKQTAKGINIYIE